MERKEFSIARFLSSKSRFDNIVLLEGFIVGILAGVVAVIYRLMLSYGEKIAYFVVDYIKNNTTMTTTGWVTDDNVYTQSQVLEGMFAYDTNALLNDSYTVHPVDCLLNTQLSDGSFPSGYNAEYTTAEVAKTLGTYKNGSVIIKAKKAYDKMMNPEQPDNTKPAQPTDTKKDSQSTNKVETTNQKTTSVKTGDETNVVIFVSLSMVSGGLFLVLRKEYERVH